LPSRAQRWQSLYDLSIDILKGFGLSLSSGAARAPGYILDTWRVWEDLLGIAMRLELGTNRVRIQKSSVLGTRNRIINNCIVHASQTTITPDFVLLEDVGGGPRFLVDAKYKTRIDNGRNRIAEPDLYEALAFSTATCCNYVVLAYPAVPRESLQLGQVMPFEKIEVGSVKIIGVEIEIKGISSTNGWTKFSKCAVKEIQNIVALNK